MEYVRFMVRRWAGRSFTGECIVNQAVRTDTLAQFGLPFAARGFIMFFLMVANCKFCRCFGDLV